MGEDELPSDRDEAGSTLMKRCPDCAELVQPDARVCRFCRFTFDTGLSADAGEFQVELVACGNKRAKVINIVR